MGIFYIGLYITLFIISVIYLLFISYSNRIKSGIEYYKNNLSSEDYYFWKESLSAFKQYNRKNLIYPSEFTWVIDSIIDDIEMGILESF